jgi:hypothetical protein
MATAKKARKTRQFVWANPTFYTKVDPENVADRIYVLIETLGRFPMKSDIVRDAREPDSPLYKLVEHNPNKAKDLYNAYQINKIFSDLRIARRGKATRTRAFYFVWNDKKKGVKKVFMPAAMALRQQPTHDQIVEAAYRRYMSFFKAFKGERRFKQIRPAMTEIKRFLEHELMAAIGG